MYQIVCFGEVLWDNFPSGKKPGGAPMNVGLHLNKQGIDSTLISSVGNDESGEELIAYLSDQNLPTNFIQSHPNLPTGLVEVVLDENKQASYIIVGPVAWDEIFLTDPSVTVVKNADAFVFGSLAARSQTSRATLLSLLNESKLSIFDINLRPPHFDLLLIDNLIQKCSILKVNEDELVVIKNLYKIPGTAIQEILSQISALTNTQTICVTLGDKGAAVFHCQKFYQHTGYKIKVADTVGAGDAFLGSFIKSFLDETPMEKNLSLACAAGALVASKHGANPSYTNTDIERIANSNLTSG